jgi:hypothetical protein
MLCGGYAAPDQKNLWRFAAEIRAALSFLIQHGLVKTLSFYQVFRYNLS